MGIINAGTGFFIGRLFDVQLSAELRHKGDTIFNRIFDGGNNFIVDRVNNRIRIPNHFFKTGEQLEYQFPDFLNATEGNSNAIGIAETNVVNVGITTRLPRTLFAVAPDNQFLQLAETREDALQRIPKVFDITRAGIGASHKFIGEKPNTRSLITIDNVIQTPSIDTQIQTSLLEDFSGASDLAVVVGVTSFFTGDLIRIGNELMKIEFVGAGNSTTFVVRRPILGSNLEDHLAGDPVVKQTGAYQIVDNIIYFPVPPFDKNPTTDFTRTDPLDRDYVGLETFSTFNGRVFLRSGFEDTTIGPYEKNFLLDDISNQFLGISTQAVLKNQGDNVTGFSTGNALVLINNVFQTPDFIDYGLGESAGVTTIRFTGNTNSNPEDINTASIPRGGIIVSIGNNEGYGYQPLVAAGGTATVSAAGTISEISIGYTGSGYRAPEVLTLTSKITYPTEAPSNRFFINDVDGLFDKLNLLSSSGNTIITLSVEDSIGINLDSTQNYTRVVSIGDTFVDIANGVDAWDDVAQFSSYEFFADTTSTEPAGIGTNKINVFNTLGVSTSAGNPTYYLTVTNAAINVEIIAVDDVLRTFTIDSLTLNSFADNSSVVVNTLKPGITSTTVQDNVFLKVENPNLGFANIYVDTLKAYTATVADYDEKTGLTTITAPGLNFLEGDFVDLRNFKYVCDSGGSFNPQGLSVNRRQLIDDIAVDESINEQRSVYDATYDPVSGIATIFVGVHTFSSDRFYIEPEALGFSCDLDSNATTSYYPGPNDANYKRNYEILSTTATSVVVNVGDAGTNNSVHTFERVNASTLGILPEVIDATYDAASGISTITFASNHQLQAGLAYSVTDAQYTPNGTSAGLTTIFVLDTTGLSDGDQILLAPESLGFSCTEGPGVTYYPRPVAGDGDPDPAYDTLLTISAVTGNKFEFNAGDGNGSTGLHSFVGVNTETPYPIKVVTGDFVFLEEEGLTFTCTLGPDPSSYPREGDYAYNRLIEVLDVPDNDKIVVYVGYSQPGDVYPHTFDSAITQAVKSSTGQTRYTSGIVTFTNVGDEETELNVGDLVLIRNTGTELDGFNYTVTDIPVSYDGSTQAFTVNVNENSVPAPVDSVDGGGSGNIGDFVLATVLLPSGRFGFEFEVIEKLSDSTFILNTGKTVRPHTYLGGGEVRNATQGEQPVLIGFSTIYDGKVKEPVITNTGIGFTQYNVIKNLNARETALTGQSIVEISDTSGINTYTDFVRFPDYISSKKLYNILEVGEFSLTLSEDILTENIDQNDRVEILRYDNFYLNIDDPLSYSNINLIYSNDSPQGIGSYAIGDLIVGNDGKIEQFELTRSGYSYGQGEILTVPVGGPTGIPTFATFQVTGVSNAIGIFTGSLSTTLNDRFGFKVDNNTDGTRIIVGAPYDNIEGSESASGIVYAFDRVGNSFNEVGIITGSYASNQDDNFGFSIAVSGDGSKIAVGAPFDENPTVGIESGQVYLYDRDDGPPVGFNTVGILSGFYSGSGDRFGWSVDMSRDGNIILVGAIGDEAPSNANQSGLLYVYERDDGPPIQFNQIGIIEGTLAVDVSDNFGTSVAISPEGSYIAVGAQFDEDTATPSDSFGLVYVYEKDLGTVNQVGIITSPKLTTLKSQDKFGYSVDVSNNGKIIAVGAVDDKSGLGLPTTGLVYVFEKINGNNFYLVQVLKGLYSNETGDRFGESISISDDGRIIAVGAIDDEQPGSPDSSGVVYLYERRTFNYFGLDYVNVGIKTGVYANNLNANYGTSVSLSGDGNNLLVGAQFDSYNDVGIGTTGVVYSYDVTTGNTFEEFQILIDQTFTDSFAGLVFGDLVVFDDISRLFNGSRVDFPILLRGIQTTLRARPGSALELEYNLIVFINDIYQVPNEAYKFEGGSILTFVEPPNEGDKCVIVFYFGTTEVDTQFVDILETIKIGDTVTVNSQNISLQQDPRTVTDITATDILETNTYSTPGVTLDENLQRPITWCKQLVDKIVDGNVVGKSRKPYEPEIYPKTTLLRSVGIGSTENDIYLDNVRTFFDSNDEYEDVGVNKRPQRDVFIIEERVAIAASATSTLSGNLGVASVNIDYPGFNYIEIPEVSISNPNFTGIGTTSNQRAQAEATLTDGRITSISVTNPGYGYTDVAPNVFISPPKTKYERIEDVIYDGDFGVLTGIGTAGAVPEPITQVGLVTGVYASDSADNFGYSVAVNRTGSSFVVGSPFDEFVGSGNTGLAYVYDYDYDTDTITGIATLSQLISDVDTVDSYGTSVGMSGDGTIVAVGAPFDEIGFTNGGVLHVYERSGDTFTQLNAFDARSGIGFTTIVNETSVLADSIDITSNGKVISAGALSEDEGYVYLFEREVVGVGTYLRLQRFTGSEAIVGSKFGCSVSFDEFGNTLCVGSYEDNKVYVYSKNVTSGLYAERFIIEEPLARNLGFGYSVDISLQGTTMVISEGGSSGSQYAYIYDFNKVKLKWILNQTIILDDQTTVTSVSISDNGRTIVVGSKDDPALGFNDCGATYVYKRTGKNHKLVKKLSGSNSTEVNADFGRSCKISDTGKVIIVGAPGSEVTGSGDRSGISYVFKNPTPNLFENNIVFELYIENDSYLRNTQVVDPKVLSTLSRGDYFRVNNSNLGLTGYGITSLNIYNGQNHFIGTNFLDCVYQVSSVSIARTEVYSLSVGSGRTDVLQVTVPVESWNQIDIPSGGPAGEVDGNVGFGYTYNGYFGDYSWGRIFNYKRTTRKTFELYDDYGSTVNANNPGITTTAKVIRTNPLKSEGYTPNS